MGAKAQEKDSKVPTRTCTGPQAALSSSPTLPKTMVDGPYGRHSTLPAQFSRSPLCMGEFVRAEVGVLGYLGEERG